MSTLRKYLEGALTLARTGGAYRTDAEYKTRRAAAVRAQTSRFTGVHWERITGKWKAQIRVRGSIVQLGAFDDEEDAARAYDAAVVKYRNAPTVNFPGESPPASVLAALPAAPAAPAVAPPRRSGRAPAPKVIVDAPDERCPAQKRKAKRPRKRCPLDSPSFLSRNWVEGAIQKVNGKWSSPQLFPGREFDDLDAYRAAKAQRAARLDIKSCVYL